LKQKYFLLIIKHCFYFTGTSKVIGSKKVRMKKRHNRSKEKVNKKKLKNLQVHRNRISGSCATGKENQDDFQMPHLGQCESNDPGTGILMTNKNTMLQRTIMMANEMHVDTRIANDDVSITVGKNDLLKRMAKTEDQLILLQDQFNKMVHINN
jgi:hypothetical protein